MGAPTGPHRLFPSGAAYAEALQHTELCFRHPELKGARPELTRLGLPRAISGAFASVFSLTSAASGKRYAVKCFTRHVPDQELRYQEISAELAALDLGELSQPWKLGFDYLPDAIRVGKDRFPVLKMDWIEAVTLSSWLDSHHGDSAAVDRLAGRFADLTADLSSHGIAHGDLQHGNLLVARDGTFRLVDYDGMYVPALAGHGGTERGHRNYQSPARGNDDFGAELDRFSSWVIFLALKAVAADPGLWSRLHEPSGEFLLLTEEDFKSPSTSAGLLTLLSHPDRTVSGLADHVRSLAYQPLDALPPLTPAGPAIPAQVTAAQAGAASPSTPSPSGAGPLPRWMADHLPAPEPAAPPSPQVAGAGRQAGFLGRRLSDVVTAVLLPLSIAASVLMVLAGLLVPTGTQLAPLAFTALVCAFARRRRTETRHARQVLTDLHHRMKQLDSPERSAEKLRKERAGFDDSETDRKARLPREQQKLNSRYHKDLKAAEEAKVRTLRDTDQKIAAVDSDLRQALVKALTARQADFVQDRLSRKQIAHAQVRGIGEALTHQLALAGIRTAADFTGYRSVQNAAYNSVGAVLVLRGGRAVKVPGIGEAKAKALVGWRRREAAAAEAVRPTRLPAAERASIERDFERRRTLLARRRKDADAAADTARAGAKSRLEDGLARLAQEDAAATLRAQQERQEFSRRSIRLQQDKARYEALRGALDEARRHSRELTYARYLRFLYVGR
ncbi:hypothetical protein [Streptomyces sp. NBC_01408]|uniref:hypothetical protein n=1 Tax=Streptomyces sp. NBC_01408 TaxID=2903855 RepID=UPI00225123E1|nr:hypothetical protein [Streptomyces sp. NBC_01408]MCX4693955.1 hypothetical protein [Streptomyces sp. NBC_01408]